MVRRITELVESWKLESGRRNGELLKIDELLADRAGQPVQRTPAGLELRILEAVAGSSRIEVASPRAIPQFWKLAAAACLLLAVGVVVRMSLTHPQPPSNAESVAMLKMPVSPQPMLRLVAGSFDQPLRVETARMMSDTRRATRAMTRCVPFTRWGN